MAIINGDDTANNLSGTSGDDTIAGALGNDTLAGGDGQDFVDGGGDNDSLDGGSGNDTLDGGSGNDTVIGGAGNDLMYGWTGNDLLVGGSGQDSLYGEAGDDGFDLNTVTDLTGCIISGGAGSDSADLIQGVLQLGTTLPFVEVELLDTYLTDFRGTAGNDSYDFRPFNTWSPGFGLPAEITLSAGAGDDVVYASNTPLGSFFNTLNGEGGNDSLTGGPSGDRLNGGDQNDTLIGGGGSDTLTGGAANDRLEGGDGNDTLNGSGGNDTALGGNGNDLVYAVLGTDVAAGGDGVDTLDTTSYGGNYLVNLVTGATNFAGESFTEFEHLVAGAGNDTLIGTAAGNDITGGTGNDSLDGGAGVDTLRGGSGDDLYIVDAAGDLVLEAGNDTAAGADTVRSAVSQVLSDIAGQSGYGIERVELQGSANLNATGNGLNNVLVGNGGANLLDGGEGSDRLEGGAGNDTLRGVIGNDSALGGDGDDLVYASYGTDTAVGGAGIDTLDTSSYGGNYLVNLATGTTNFAGESYTEFENLVAAGGNDTLIGTAAANAISGAGGHDGITGGAGDDTLAGGLGNDTLDGGSGADRLEGADGDDLYLVDDVGDVVIDALAGAPGGVDTVRSSVSITLGATAGQDSFGIERVELLGSANLVATGNVNANTLVGNDGANLLIGGGGTDSVYGGLGDDTVVASLSGVYEGNGGTDLLDLSGAAAAADGTLFDLTADAMLVAGGGQFAGFEHLIATAGAEVVHGSALANRVEGRDGDDTLLGAGGADTLAGGNGEDLLDGGSGNDTLDGGAGLDLLVGGRGSDVYFVDAAGDMVFEASSLATDIDTVNSSVTWTLGANLERLVLGGNAAINGTGNTLANQLTGNAAANVLNGGTGADTLIGGAGGDTYVVDHSGDVTTETGPAGEIDTVRASVTRTLGANLENLVLTGSAALNGTGNALANTLTGNGGANELRGGSGNDTLSGGAGDDVLDGGLGNDLLAGGSGADLFRFGTALNATSNVDQVQGFVAADDSFVLARTVFSAIGVGTLAAGAFRAGTAAGDTNDRIVYDSASGQLFYDADGSGAGAQVLFATVTAGTALTASDFVIV
ncbi:beta strand repeat-containing protein [Piscinibacter defluvii]|uniref:beta strand repeat-containing protein n=1 Tax=Piscinibacter defluvii TaxID=1796922 RepID=UPI000FDCE7BA|nr:calcium-binding protein [Piscinibacter defluvii]